MDEYYKIISSCCYVRENGSILMLHRNKPEGRNMRRFYRGLGGKVEQGETAIDGVKREVIEEAGIRIVPIWRGILNISVRDRRDWETHFFTAEGYTGKVQECNEGSLKWVSELVVLRLDLPEADRRLFPYLFNGPKFYSSARYDEFNDLRDFRIEFI